MAYTMTAEVFAIHISSMHKCIRPILFCEIVVSFDIQKLYSLKLLAHLFLSLTYFKSFESVLDLYRLSD